MVHEPAVNREYEALVDKVSAFSEPVFERTRADMACKRGCDSCCHVWLSVNQREAAQLRSALEALAPDARARVAERGRRELAREAQPDAAAARCAMLEPDGSCAVYEQRPLVCRTQGFALRYPVGFIPAAAVRARTATGEVTHCSLNFVERAPPADAVLDAERVDAILSIVSQRFSSEHQLDPDVRHALSRLAAG
jgi:uncharacterized protein